MFARIARSTRGGGAVGGRSSVCSGIFSVGLYDDETKGFLYVMLTIDDGLMLMMVMEWNGFKGSVQVDGGGAP